MITLQQDSEGFIRMNRHFPESIRVSVTFSDGTVEEVSGQRLNQAYDEALAEFRAQNHLDAKRFSRNQKSRTNPGNKVDFVRVQPGMGD
ncbi:hypothetical protein ACHMXB_01590 [Arthrobacter sp. UC242_113]|uniref:hypothetical protein n=1 Tax=Arthrobacter sp. UC242_113 TaxID=3374550 RepID=UPI003756B34D